MFHVIIHNRAVRITPGMETRIGLTLKESPNYDDGAKIIVIPYHLYLGIPQETPGNQKKRLNSSHNDLRIS